MEDVVKKNEVLKQKADYYGKWFWILFWFLIVFNVLTFFVDGTLFDIFKELSFLVLAVSAVNQVGYALILMKMSEFHENYKKASKYLLIAAIVYLMAQLLLNYGDLAEFSTMFSLITAIIGFFAQKQELLSHEDVLLEYDLELSKRWGALWKWTLRMIMLIVATLVVMLLLPLVGLLMLLGYAVGMFVIGVLKIVTLYKTAMFFKKYTVQEGCLASQENENQL